MNVYDLDGTILKGDSEDYFFNYCFNNLNLSKKAKRKFKFYNLLHKKLKVPSKITRPKQYYFLREINDLDKLLEDFWDEHIKYIYDYYKIIKKDDDCISTASPLFLEIPLFKKLNIKNYIGTNLNPKTGELLDTNFNFGEYKLINFKNKFGDIKIDNFFSDSYSDFPLASISTNYYKIVDGYINEWNYVNMRRLFVMDLKDYDLNNLWTIRPSTRAIIIKDNKLALIYSKKYNYYKFPGGGINKNEYPIDSLIRETKEETGLNIIEKSIKPFGSVYKIKKDMFDDNKVFIQNNYYYFADVSSITSNIKLDDYEKEEEFELVFEDPLKAIETNFKYKEGFEDKSVAIREVKVIEILLNEGYIKK